jgi:hypothetical protein
MITLQPVSRVSIENFVDKVPAENEDRYLIDTDCADFARFVLCDGAGGVGVFSREWADFLSQAIPSRPHDLSNDSIKWFEDIAGVFHENVILKHDLSDLILKKKVYRDGSYATLCACWIEMENDIIHFTAVGDTFLFLFEKIDDGYKIGVIYPLERQHDIDQNPELLNWSTELSGELEVKTHKLESEFVVLLASDSLAKWLLLQIFTIDPIFQKTAQLQSAFLESINHDKYTFRKDAIARGSKKNTIDDLLSYLEIICKNSGDFRTAVMQLYQNAEIDLDDYSLIYVRGNVSK